MTLYVDEELKKRGRKRGDSDSDEYEEEDSDEFEEEELKLDEAINYDDWNIIDDENTVEIIDGIHKILSKI